LTQTIKRREKEGGASSTIKMRKKTLYLHCDEVRALGRKENGAKDATRKEEKKKRRITGEKGVREKKKETSPPPINGTLQPSLKSHS